MCYTTPTPVALVARPHGCTDKSKRPESHPTKECARACTMSQDRTKLLLLSYNFSNVLINSTSLNEVHYMNPYLFMLISLMFDVAPLNLFMFVVIIRLECKEDFAFIVLR
jgi:hypothetical protein